MKDGKAKACLSEDTDLFVYGCPIVLRYFNLYKETFVEYKLTAILNNLELDFNSFQDICIISGTDSNESQYQINTLYDIYMNEYKKIMQKFVHSIIGLNKIIVILIWIIYINYSIQMIFHTK